jgi:tRNA pseudouridine38-40 synthase
VFQSYNRKCGEKYDREPIDFSKYQQQMDVFRREEIYQRIMEEELALNR